MDSSWLSDDQLVQVILGALALASIVPGLRTVTTPGKRGRGIVLLALGMLLASILYFFATFTIRMF